jgi:hypothetical protein
VILPRRIINVVAADLFRFNSGAGIINHKKAPRDAGSCDIDRRAVSA